MIRLVFIPAHCKFFTRLAFNVYTGWRTHTYLQYGPPVQIIIIEVEEPSMAHNTAFSWTSGYRGRNKSRLGDRMWKIQFMVQIVVDKKACWTCYLSWPHVTQLHCWVFGSVVQDEVQDAIAAAQLKDLMKETDVSFKTKHNRKGVENMSINSQV